MSNLFDLEIVTPRRTQYSGSVQSVSCPGAQGRFQVLHSHAPFLSTLTVGMVKVLTAEGGESRFAISGGIAQVFHNQMRVLADSAERADQIDVDRAERARRRAEERLAAHSAEVDEDRAQAALLRAINRLKIARGE
ncbi:MAG: F0F1 ATP synthase subunit epsilon [Bacteroidota bacterium]|jgi:F-type H+-transporting ATPase subunit epsilon|nr:F0F1 ATP synthase subunit epsilon [Bacteroidota bacterium]